MSNQSLGCSVFAVSLPMQLGVTTIINFTRSLAKSYLRLLRIPESSLSVSIFSEGTSDDDADDSNDDDY